MSSKAKIKGKRFEDIIAKKIAKALNLTKQECHRSSFSGNSSWDYGDIYVKDYAIVAECKFQEQFDMRHFIPNFNKEIKNWLKQLEESASKFSNNFGITPFKVLIVSKAYYPIFYIMDKQSNNKDIILQLHDKHIEGMSHIDINGRYIILFREEDFINLIQSVAPQIKL